MDSPDVLQRCTSSPTLGVGRDDVGSEGVRTDLLDQHGCLLLGRLLGAGARVKLRHAQEVDGRLKAPRHRISSVLLKAPFQVAVQGPCGRHRVVGAQAAPTGAQHDAARETAGGFAVGREHGLDDEDVPRVPLGLVAHARSPHFESWALTTQTEKIAGQPNPWRA